MQTTNDWGLHYNTVHNKSFERLETRNRQDFPVHMCLTCNKVYEEKRNEYRKVMVVKYHEDFPTLGLVRRECSKCKKED